MAFGAAKAAQDARQSGSRARDLKACFMVFIPGSELYRYSKRSGLNRAVTQYWAVPGAGADVRLGVPAVERVPRRRGRLFQMASRGGARGRPEGNARKGMWRVDKLGAAASATTTTRISHAGGMAGTAACPAIRSQYAHAESGSPWIWCAVSADVRSAEHKAATGSPARAACADASWLTSGASTISAMANRPSHAVRCRRVRGFISERRKLEQQSNIRPAAFPAQAGFVLALPRDGRRLLGDDS